MRSASSSMRRIVLARSSGRSAAPRRNSSAYPRIDVSGVRSSCDASATKRRSRASDCGAFGERGLDLMQHLVERDAEPADLGRVVDDLDAVREVAGRDRAGGLLHLLRAAAARA